MALGNVFIRDVDGNIPYDTGSSGEKVTGLLFDVSLQPELFTEGYGKTNESKLRLGDVCYILQVRRQRFRHHRACGGNRRGRGNRELPARHSGLPYPRVLPHVG